MPDLNVIDASAELRLLRFLDSYAPPFDLIGTYRLIDDGVRPEATVTLRAGDQEMHEADLGVGPVDALANVLKKSLGQLFPDIRTVRLLDFRVRLIEGHIGTSSQIEVSVVFSDGKYLWRVSSVDDNVNLASFRALLDGYEYAIYLWGKGSGQGKGPAKPKAQSPSTSAKASVDKKAKGKAAAPGKRGKGETLRQAQGRAGKVGRAAAKSKPAAKTTTKSKTAAKVKPRTAAKPKTQAATKPKAKSTVGKKAKPKKK